MYTCEEEEDGELTFARTTCRERVWVVSQWYYVLASVNQHPPVHHPLDAYYDSVVDG
jgi:hypothetical protein